MQKLEEVKYGLVCETLVFLMIQVQAPEPPVKILGMVAHACNLSIGEAEIGGSWRLTGHAV